MENNTYHIDGTSACDPAYMYNDTMTSSVPDINENVHRHIGIKKIIREKEVQEHNDPTILKNVAGCEVTITFKPRSECKEDIKDNVLWLILEVFKERIGILSDDRSSDKGKCELKDELSNNILL